MAGFMVGIAFAFLPFTTHLIPPVGSCYRRAVEIVSSWQTGWRARPQQLTPASPLANPATFSLSVNHTNVMELQCDQVIRALSGYLDDDVTPELRVQIERHLSGCNHCTAILDGTRNVLHLISDTRTFDLPARFHRHLFRHVRKA